MTLLQIIVLALVQGITEFLPISSSAHLILVSYLFDWPDQGLVLDAAVHLGTLFAVIFYFRHELGEMLMAWLRPDGSDRSVYMKRLGGLVIIASIPVLLIGWLAYDLVAAWLRDVRVIAVATLLFGVLLWWADARFPGADKLDRMTLRSALLIGLAQVLALVPGTSRSGITITAGRWMGFSAGAAARFSFLLSIPVIGIAGAHGIYQMVSERTPVAWQEFAAATLFAALAGWVCIAAFLALLKRVGLTPFIIYRLVLGAWLAFIAF